MRRALRRRVEAMAAKKKAAAGRKKPARGKTSDAMIISKSRVKAAVRRCNVGAEFYDGLEAAVRDLIAKAEERALANKRKTLRSADV
jgi:histone H3/H4